MGTLASALRSIGQGLARVPRVYADANLPYGVVSVMRRTLGWDVLFVVEHEELRRASDRAHFRHAAELGRTLVTLDRDFLDDRRFPCALSPGVIICSAPDERTLIRLARFIDARVFRTDGAGERPLLGQKVVVTPDLLGDRS